jgi:response regulator RpfG family c-di-GMP phosphodiesterase
MFRGRILIVSDRHEVVAELDPLIRAEGHLSLSVPNADEALQVLEDGIIPDIVISDLRSQHAAESISYLSHFRQLNQLGQHLAVVPEGASGGEQRSYLTSVLRVEPFDTLPYPFTTERIRTSIQQAMDRIRRDLESLRAEMFRETARLQKAIRGAQLEMVTALAMTMEAKDPFMHGHCDRVATLARQVAEELSLDETQIEMLGTAALLHEIGKVSVSVDLLHRDGPLTPDELEQVRNHTRVGAQIVTAVPSLRRMAPLISHQYTDYKELESVISSDAPEFLLASILRVVDSFDAMISPRSYRGGLTRARGEEMIHEGAGSSFHPEAVRALSRVLSRS